MIGKRVRELRMKMGLSQQELGNAIGVTKVSVCGYESGTRIPNLEKLAKLADALHTSTDYLLGREIVVNNEEKTEEKYTAYTQMRLPLCGEASFFYLCFCFYSL